MQVFFRKDTKDKKHLNTLVVFLKTVHSFPPSQALFRPFCFHVVSLSSYQAQTLAGYKDEWSRRDTMNGLQKLFLNPRYWFNDQRFIDILSSNKK